MKNKRKIGLALSGGGARGIAHIGVLKALQENNIPIHCVSGTSAGSIVGALLASGVSTDEMIRFVRESSLLKVYEIGFPITGLTKLTYLKKQLAKFIKEDQLEALNIPLYVAATNLNNGQCILFQEGNLFDIVMASSSIPLVFKPVEINGEWYVDGGVLNNFPIEPLLKKEKVDVLIGVNVMPLNSIKNKSFTTGLGIAARCSELQVVNIAQDKKHLCDVFIEPQGVLKYQIYNFSKVDELLSLGYEAAMGKMEEILQKVT